MDDWLEARRTPLALILLVALVVGAVLWLQRVGDHRPLVVAISSPTLAPGGLMAYVSGEVARPGVYQFQEGDRVEQVLAAAGGPTADADLSAINLAVRLKDEQQVHVPRKSAASGPTTPAVPLIDLNTASVAELETLPRIGPVTAQRIVDYRTRNGPFQGVEDLKAARLVTDSVFEAIRGLVEAR